MNLLVTGSTPLPYTLQIPRVRTYVRVCVCVCVCMYRVIENDGRDLKPL